MLKFSPKIRLGMLINKKTCIGIQESESQKSQVW